MVGSNFNAKVTDTLWISLRNPEGYATVAECIGIPPTTANIFAHGCLILQKDTATGAKALFENIGSLAVPNWSINGSQSPQEEITATSDGLTTGLITIGSQNVVVTSASADNIATLPAGTAGQTINIYVGANGCELRTPATSGATINNVDSDGTNELALGATTSYICTCVATDTWIVRGFTNLGADQAALVPDTA